MYAASEDPLPGVDSGLIADHLADKGLENVSLVPGHEGITDWQDREECQYYLCGAFSMIFDVHAQLREKGVDDSRIFAEEYYYQSDADL